MSTFKHQGDLQAGVGFKEWRDGHAIFEDSVHGTVIVTIDAERILREYGTKALLSKRHQSKYMDGCIVMTASNVKRVPGEYVKKGL